MLGASGNHLSIPEVARAARIPVQSMRRRLLRLAKKWPDLLVSLAPPGRTVRKYWVNAQVLEQVNRLGEGYDPQEAKRELATRIEELEQRLAALRCAHRKLKRHVAAIEKAKQ